MEDLSCLIKRVVNEGFLFGCGVTGRGGRGVPISHLLFVNDILVCCEDSQDNMVFLSWL